VSVSNVEIGTSKAPPYDLERMQADLRHRLAWAGPEPGRLGLIAVYSDPDKQGKEHEKLVACNVPVDDPELAIETAFKFINQYVFLPHWNIYGGLHILRPDIASNQRGKTEDCVECLASLLTMTESPVSDPARG
jgi:hypothetical protein